ncbi:MAG: hypothetical protein ACI9RM_001292 [Ulvibacter sp.]|jgi:hypothetical protein
MDLLEIKLENPIGLDEVIRLKSELILAKKHDFLIIDTGAYDFESTKVLNHFRTQLADLEPCLTKFKKIALIMTPLYEAENSNRYRHNYCSSKEEAIEWLESK